MTEQICVNACSDKEYCFMLKPYYECGHVMCFSSGAAINWCIQCGCKSRNEASFCYAYDELMANHDDSKDIKKS